MKRSYNHWASYSHFLPGLGGVVILLLLFLLGALLGNLTVLGLQALAGQAFADKFGTLISYPVMFIPAMLYASAMSRINEYSTPEVPLDKGGFGRKGWTILISGSIFSTIAAAYVTEPLTALLPAMPAWLEEAMKMMLENMPAWATLLSVSVFAPLFEEWLCRGIVLRGLLEKTSPFVAVTVSAAFFALLHMNPWQAIPAFCLGLLFGYAYYRTGSLKLTMLMHCTNNTLAVILNKIPQFKDAETFMDILSPWAYWCIFAACMVTVCCFVVIVRNFSKKEQ